MMFEVSLEPLGFAVWRLDRNNQRISRVLCEGNGTFDGYCFARVAAERIAADCDLSNRTGEPIPRVAFADRAMRAVVEERTEA